MYHKTDASWSNRRKAPISPKLIWYNHTERGHTVQKIAFIGAGNMASAIIGGNLQNGEQAVFPRESIIVYDINPEKAAALSVTCAATLIDAVKQCDFCVFCVKPQHFEGVLAEISAAKPDLSGKRFVTIAAGISTAFIEKYLGAVPVIRIMPNTPLLVGSGVSAVCRNAYVAAEDFHLIFSLFSSIGYAFEIDEKYMNEIVAVNGSSPAYIFLFLKALMDGAKESGLSLDEATLREVACRSMIGSALLLLSSDKTPEQLISDVTSPAGTTEKAMAVLYGAGFADTVKEAMRACTKRAYELTK